MTTKQTIWNGLKAVRLYGGDYEAIVLPEYGANCISLVHKPSGSELLRVPASSEQIMDGCNVYGLPLLFPPNRVKDGRYTFEGREYALPVNEPDYGNHIHGFLSRTEFEYEGGGSFVYNATEDKPYTSFPHAFALRREYMLDSGGLKHTITVANYSAQNMPVGIGVHAALRSPVGDGCRLRADVIRRWQIESKHLLPTGESVADEPLLKELREGTLAIQGKPLSALLECKPGTEVVLYANGGTWHCAPDPAFKFIMLWNGEGTEGFVCPEPQSWMTNAPNMALPSEATGLISLAPNASASFGLKYYYTEG